MNWTGFIRRPVAELSSILIEHGDGWYSCSDRELEIALLSAFADHSAAIVTAEMNPQGWTRPLFRCPWPDRTMDDFCAVVLSFLLEGKADVFDVAFILGSVLRMSPEERDGRLAALLLR